MSGMKMNDRQMKQAMKKMGIKQTQVEDVVEVVIRTKTSEIVISQADVVCIDMPGSRSYQVSGNETVRQLGESGEPVVTFPDEDIELVMSQAQCDRNTAVAALEAADGQPAEAILKIMTG